jgi:Lrp/AsnC family transcriptional regulator for asnA, asnC and gidA
MDKIDRAIIALLQYDGRMPFTDIAAELGISEGTVRRRVKRLTESGVLQAGQIDAVAQQIAQFHEVSYLFMASGEFDLFVEVFCKDREHFVSFLSQKLQQVPGVERTQTFTILKMYKLSYRWGEAEPPRANHRPRIDLEGWEQDL